MRQERVRSFETVTEVIQPYESLEAHLGLGNDCVRSVWRRELWYRIGISDYKPPEFDQDTVILKTTKILSDRERIPESKQEGARVGRSHERR